MTPELLNLCACISHHPRQRVLLNQAFESFTRWDKLLHRAESQGMVPLLHHHLTRAELKPPEECARGLRFLCLRHKHANALLLEELRNTLSILEERGIPSLILKGGALSTILYPEPGLRPMRDIDIMLEKADAEQLYCILLNRGFSPSPGERQKEYYHLPSLYRTIGTARICIELHHGLFPEDPPYYQERSFTELFDKSESFSVDGVTAHCFGTEDMLWHLYLHGLRAPLTFEPYKLISIADIVSLVKKRADDIDWDRLYFSVPQLKGALSAFHHITPWDKNILEKEYFSAAADVKKAGEHYKGWPDSENHPLDCRSQYECLVETFMPGHWWRIVYYGSSGVVSDIWSLFVLHPLHILRWIKILCRVRLNDCFKGGSEDTTTPKGKIQKGWSSLRRVFRSSLSNVSKSVGRKKNTTSALFLLSWKPELCCSLWEEILPTISCFITG